MEKKLSSGAQPRTPESQGIGRVNSPVITPRDDMFSSRRGPLEAKVQLDSELIKAISEFAGFQLKTL